MDLVLAADVVWLPELVEPLVATLRTVLLARAARLQEDEEKQHRKEKQERREEVVFGSAESHCRFSDSSESDSNSDFDNPSDDGDRATMVGASEGGDDLAAILGKWVNELTDGCFGVYCVALRWTK
jgi:hypothetical protein